MKNLSQKVALITGASRGIGAASAKKLAQYGAQLVLAARSKADLDAVAADIIQHNGKADTIECDVSDFASVSKAVNFCVEKFGRLDILLNNAGVIDPIARMADSDPEAWVRAIDINLKGVYFGMRAAAPVMEKQGSGTIINMSSGAASSPLEGWSHYCASKAAVKMLTECAHKELQEQGISIIGLSPGTVATDMMQQIKQSGINPVSQLDWSTHISAEWVGEAVAYLCTSEAKDLSGTDFSLKTEEGRRRVGLSTK